MIWPRLELLCELLSEDGSIWVSIDDNEGHYLKVVKDKMFGRKKSVETSVWERDADGRGDASVSVSHDYIHCYAADRRIRDKTRNLLTRTADTGMLFLDEIGELGLDEQAMILRAIEDKRFLPVCLDAGGGSRPIDTSDRSLPNVRCSDGRVARSSPVARLPARPNEVRHIRTTGIVWHSGIVMLWHAFKPDDGVRSERWA